MRRWLLPLLALLPAPLGAAMAPAMPAPLPDRMVLAPDAEAQWVPFELTPGNQIRFRMTVDGRAATAILDTGFSQSVISRRWANAARACASPMAASGIGIGGSVAMGAVNGRTLVIGGLTKTGGRLGVLDLPVSATGSDAAIDAVIGSDMLRHYALDIDFAARRFRLLPSGRLPFAGQSAPLSLSGRDQLYISELRDRRHAAAPDDRRYRRRRDDRGVGGGVASARRAARPATTTTVSYSVAGAVQSGLAVLPEIAVGDATLRQAETLIEPGGGFSSRMGASGRIGIGFLQRFRVLLDPRAGRMVMAATARHRPAAAALDQRPVARHRDRPAARAPRHARRPRGGGRMAGGRRNLQRRRHRDLGGLFAATRSRCGRSPRPGRVVRLGLCGGGVRALTLKSFY